MFTFKYLFKLFEKVDWHNGSMCLSFLINNWNILNSNHYREVSYLRDCKYTVKIILKWTYSFQIMEKIGK